MKHSWIRLVSLTLLLAMLVGTMPAFAAAKPTLFQPKDNGDNFWQGDWVRIQVNNLPKGATITSVKSAKTSIIEIIEGTEDHPWFMHGLKEGKSKVTVKYTLKSGKTKSVSAYVEVTKYPDAIKSIYLNGKKLKLNPKENIEYQAHGYKKTSTKIKVTANSGWKIEKIILYLEKYDGSASKEKDVTKKNNKSVSTPESYDLVQYLILFKNKKTGVIYHSVLTLRRD